MSEEEQTEIIEVEVSEELYLKNRLLSELCDRLESGDKVIQKNEEGEGRDVVIRVPVSQATMKLALEFLKQYPPQDEADEYGVPTRGQVKGVLKKFQEGKLPFNA